MITKQKNRYVLVEATEPVGEADRAIADGMMAGILREMGAVAYLDANPKIVSRQGDRFFVIRVNRGYEGILALALSFVKEAGGTKIAFYTLKTSGTIRKILSYKGRLF